MTVGIYSMRSLTRHSLIKVLILDFSKVNKESACNYRILDSKGNKTSLQNRNDTQCLDNIFLCYAFL